MALTERLTAAKVVKLGWPKINCKHRPRPTRVRSSCDAAVAGRHTQSQNECITERMANKPAEKNEKKNVLSYILKSSHSVAAAAVDACTIGDIVTCELAK